MAKIGKHDEDQWFNELELEVTEEEKIRVHVREKHQSWRGMTPEENTGEVIRWSYCPDQYYEIDEDAVEADVLKRKSLVRNILRYFSTQDERGNSRAALGSDIDAEFTSICEYHQDEYEGPDEWSAEDWLRESFGARDVEREFDTIMPSDYQVAALLTRWDKEADEDNITLMGAEEFLWERIKEAIKELDPEDYVQDAEDLADLRDRVVYLEQCNEYYRENFHDDLFPDFDDIVVNLPVFGDAEGVNLEGVFSYDSKGLLVYNGGHWHIQKRHDVGGEED